MNSKTPICPLMLFFESDRHKCNISLCNYDKRTKDCTMKCLKKEDTTNDNRTRKSVETG